MKYHVIPCAKLDRTLEEVDKIKGQMSETIKEVTGFLKKTRNKSVCDGNSNYNSLFYLANNESVNDLFSKLISGDEVVIHAEGNPWVIGLSDLSRFDLRAFQLAELFGKLLTKNNKQDIAININLIVCNSATLCQGVNYARETSEALSSFFNCKNITVTGYTGFVNAKNTAKFSIAGTIGGGGDHSNMNEACVVYQNGLVIKGENAKKVADLSNTEYGYVEDIKVQRNKDQEKVQQAKQNHIKSELNHLKQSPLLVELDEQQLANNDLLNNNH